MEVGALATTYINMFVLRQQLTAQRPWGVKHARLRFKGQNVKTFKHLKYIHFYLRVNCAIYGPVIFLPDGPWAIVL